jgi:hypothetical protein
LLLRTENGTGEMPLLAREAKLLLLLIQHPVGEALALLEADCSQADRATLPQDAQRWLAKSVKLGIWSGIDPCAQ